MGGLYRLKLPIHAAYKTYSIIYSSFFDAAITAIHGSFCRQIIRGAIPSDFGEEAIMARIRSKEMGKARFQVVASGVGITASILAAIWVCQRHLPASDFKEIMVVATSILAVIAACLKFVTSLLDVRIVRRREHRAKIEAHTEMLKKRHSHMAR